MLLRWPLPALRIPRATASISPKRPPNNFDGLRLLGALLVIFGHSTHDTTGTAGMRVLMFFAISGFLVAGSWNADPHITRFLWRRFLRIWPAFAVMVIVCAAVSAAFPAPDMPEISRLASLFYLRNLWYSGFDWGFFPFTNPFMNHPLWMLPYEATIYCAFALIGLIDRRLLPWAAAAALVTAVVTSLTPAARDVVDVWLVHLGGFFAVGVLLRFFPAMRQTRAVFASVLAGAALLAFGVRNVGLLCIIPSAFVWIGERSWPVLRSAARFGDLSFGIFLWGWPVQQVTRLWVSPQTPAALFLLLVIAQAAALAWVSWHLIESRALSLRPAKPSASTATVPQATAAVPA